MLKVMTPIDEFYGLNGSTARKEALENLAGRLYNDGAYDEARRSAYIASIIGDDEVEIEITQQGLAGPSQKTLVKKALNDCGRLNPGYRFKKGGGIIEVKKVKSDKTFDLFPQRNKLAKALGLTYEQVFTKNGLLRKGFYYKKGGALAISKKESLHKKKEVKSKSAFAKAKKGTPIKKRSTPPKKEIKKTSLTNNKSKFVKDRIAATFKAGDKKVFVYRYKKKGTNRVFYAPETTEGKRINTTMYVRLWEAESLAVSYLKSLVNKEDKKSEKKSSKQLRLGLTGEQTQLTKKSKEFPHPKSQKKIFPSDKKRFTASEIMTMDFKKISLPSDWAVMFPDAPEKMHLAFMGKPKNGKSVSACQWGSVIGKAKKVLYNFADQGINASTKKILQLSGLSKLRDLTITSTSTLDELEKDIKEIQPDIVFIDMINDYIDNDGATPSEFKKRFIQGYPKISFNLIFEATKTGSFKGDQKWTHLVDQLITIDDYVMSSRGRYGSGKRITWDKEAQRINPTLYQEVKDSLRLFEKNNGLVMPSKNNLSQQLPEQSQSSWLSVS